MQYDEVYGIIGEIGIFQVCVIAAMATLYMYGIAGITMIFVGADMPHWCRVDELVNLSFTQQKNIAIPYSEPGSSDYSSCQMYSLNYSVYSDEELLDWNRTLMIGERTPVVDCTQWTYDQSTFVSTIISRFNLVCDRSIYDELVFTVYSVGNLIGAFGGGTVSDRFGRKLAILVFTVVQSTGVALSSFAPNFPLFMIGRFILGIGMTAVKISTYVLAMETVGRSYRTLVSFSLDFSLSVSFILQPLIAYSTRSYVEYQLAALAPSAIFIVYSLFIPESLRWLITNGKTERADKVLQKICDVNGVKRPENFECKQFDAGGTQRRANVIALFRSPRLRYRTLVILLTWFTTEVSYYGLSLSTGSLAGDIFTNTVISGAVEVPALVAAAFLMNWPRVGRRLTLCGGLLVAAVSNFSCIPVILLGYDTASTVLSMVGKAAIVTTASTVFVMASEVFPTEARNAGMGLGTTVSAVGSMISPFIGPPLAAVWAPLPSVVFGTLAGCAGLSCLLLTETIGRPLPDTIQEAEDMAIKNDEWTSFCRCRRSTDMTS